MKISKNKRSSIMWALAGVLSLFPAVIQAIKGESLNGAAVTFLCVAVVFLCFAVGFGRRAGGGSGPPSA